MWLALTFRNSQARVLKSIEEQIARAEISDKEAQRAKEQAALRRSELIAGIEAEREWKLELEAKEAERIRRQQEVRALVEQRKLEREAEEKLLEQGLRGEERGGGGCLLASARFAFFSRSHPAARTCRPHAYPRPHAPPCPPSLPPLNLPLLSLSLTPSALPPPPPSLPQRTSSESTRTCA